MDSRKRFRVRLHYSKPAGRSWIEESEEWARDETTATAIAALKSGEYYRYLERAEVEEATRG